MLHSIVFGVSVTNRDKHRTNKRSKTSEKKLRVKRVRKQKNMLSMPNANANEQKRKNAMLKHAERRRESMASGISE
jgi:hypothetical protein